MLYKVKPPTCRTALREIVALQERLLEALCDIRTTDPLVTEAWVIHLFHEHEPEWVHKFCQSKDEIQNLKRPLLAHMKIIAGAEVDVKTELLASFRHDIQLLFDVESGTPVDHPFHGLRSLTPELQKAVRGLLETFYNPQFYEGHGYRITQTSFHKTIFLEAFNNENKNISVCPFCDGSRDEPEVDHFYPKSKHPFLSCHPLNLVPICHNCNKRSVKGDKLPLTNGAPDPMHHWFHPYFKPLLETLPGPQFPNPDTFSVAFVRQNYRLSVSLVSGDPVLSERLRKLDELIKLTTRWFKVIPRRQRALQNKISGCVRRGRAFEDEMALRRKLEEWAEDECSNFGTTEYAILSAYLYHAAAHDHDLFHELWSVHEEARSEPDHAP